MSPRGLVLIAVTLLAATSIGCGKREPELRLGEFASYVERFEQASEAHGKPVKVSDLVIEYGEMPKANQRAVCRVTQGEPPTILIHKASWDAMSQEQKESALFHELGHCVLQREHVSGEKEAGIPISLMHPYEIEPSIYLKHKSYYTQELFNPAL